MVVVVAGDTVVSGAVLAVDDVVVCCGSVDVEPSSVDDTLVGFCWFVQPAVKRIDTNNIDKTVVMFFIVLTLW
jgi:hypothetical protein